MKARDRAAVAAIRSALGAIDNAEAVDQAAAGLRAVDNAHLAGTVGGLGAAEATRVALGEQEMAGIVAGEIAERREAADQYEQLGQAAEAERLRAEAAALAALLT